MMPSTKSKPTPEPNHQWSFEAIGTQWWIGIYQPLAAAKLQDLQTEVSQRIEYFDKTYSRFRSDSLVTRLAKKAGSYTLPADAAPLMHFYDQLYDATDGLVTPMVGSLLSDAGYDADYTLTPGKLRPVADWQTVVRREGTQLTTQQPVLLDFGAAGKGYLVDLLCEVTRQQGITSFCIDASGDLRAQGLGAPLRIGMEQPSDTSLAIGVVELDNQALCASAPQRRQWAGYHHIMNPQSQSSPNHLQAVWVVADTCMLADGLTTALFFADSAALQQQFSFEYALLNADNSIKRSPGFPAEIFTK